MDTKKIGKFISENRKRKGLTQEQLGELLGVTNKTISRWENGNYMPDLSLLIPLSETLNISLNELLNGKYITCKSQYKNVGLGQYKNVGFPTFLYCLFSLHLL